jgi:leucyl/phenylalanyl-tRNA--protein transferase
VIRLPLLDPDAPASFPDPGQALTEPNGLLAFGGDLSPARLLAAYGQGIFPWFSDGEPILWWSPDPRCVLRTQDLRIGRSLRRLLANKHWHLTLDHAFDAVVRGCAAPRRDASGTWIVPAMIDAYNRLYHLGHAHSLEVWEDGQLIGGIYGIALGQLFCGESMFSRQSGASRLALVALAKLLHGWDFPLIDTQVANAHTLSLGAIEIPRAQYLQEVATLRRQPGQPGNWAAFTDELIQPCNPL